VIPSSVPPPIDQFIALCWTQDPDERPSFTTIVKFFESNEFSVPGVDAAVLSRYIAKVRLGQAPDPRLGVHDEELRAILGRVQFCDLDIILAFFNLIQQYLPATILRTRLLQFRTNPDLANDIAEELLELWWTGKSEHWTEFSRHSSPKCQI
jgi:hypothetical protein